MFFANVPVDQVGVECPVFSDIRQRQLAIQAIRNLLIEEPLITIDQDIPFTIQQNSRDFFGKESGVGSLQLSVLAVEFVLCFRQGGR